MHRSLLLAASLLAAVLARPAQAQDASLIDAEDAARYLASPATQNDVRSVAFPADAILALLGQDGATGIRAEFSVDPATGLNTLMLQAHDSAARTSGETRNLALPCPPTCNDAGGNLGALLAKLLLQGAGGKLLSQREVQAHRDATAAKRARLAQWFATVAVHFPQKALLAVLEEPGTVGVIFRYVRDREGRDTLLMYGIDENGASQGAIYVAATGG
jgi:hypothetical protein